MKVALAWLVSVFSGEAMAPDDIRGIDPPEPAADAEDSDDEGFEISDLEFEIDESSSAAILRDVREQNLFR